MGDIATRYRVVQHGMPLDTDPETVVTRGVNLLVEKAGGEGYLVVSDPVVVMDEAAVFVADGDSEGWLPVDGPYGVGSTYGPADGRTIVWEADVAPSPESTPAVGHQEPDGAVMVDVPEVSQRLGGSVRAMHRLGTTAVEVSAFKDNGVPVGYLAAVTIDGDEVEVRVHPDTALLRIAAKRSAEVTT